MSKSMNKSKSQIKVSNTIIKNPYKPKNIVHVK